MRLSAGAGARKPRRIRRLNVNVLDRRAHRAPEDDVGRRRDRQPDRRRARRGQPQRGDRQGAPPRPRGAPLAGQAGRGEGSEGSRAAAKAARRAEAGAQAERAAPQPAAPRRCRAGRAGSARGRQPHAAAPQPDNRSIARSAPAASSARARATAGADPAGAAAPPGAGQAERRGRRQDQPARPQRPHLQMADGPSGRARLPFLRQGGEPGLPLLRRALRRRLPGAAPAPRPPPARRRCRSAARASARSLSGKRRSLARRTTGHAGSSPSRIWLALSSSTKRAPSIASATCLAGMRAAHCRPASTWQTSVCARIFASSSRTSMSAASSIIGSMLGTGPKLLEMLVVPVDQLPARPTGNRA